MILSSHREIGTLDLIVGRLFGYSQDLIGAHIAVESYSLSEKGSDPLEATQFQCVFVVGEEGQTPFRTGSQSKRLVCKLNSKSSSSRLLRKVYLQQSVLES